MVRAKRTDANQKIIVEMFRKLGFSVFVSSSIGHGFPDIVCGKNGINLLVEIKDGDKPPSARKLTEEEEKFRESWNGQYCVVTCVEEVMRINEELNGLQKQKDSIAG